MTIDDKISDENLQFHINREAEKILALPSGKIDKYQYIAGEEILHFNQRIVKEQAKFTYSPIGKAFEKQIKAIQNRGRKEIGAITNQNEILEALTNQGYREDNYKEIFEELVKERFDEIKEFTNEMNQNDLIYYFKGNTARKIVDNFNNGIELFRKIQSSKRKLKEVKKLQNVFKSNLNEISRGRNKSEEQKWHQKILNCFTNYEKLLLNYLIVILKLYLRLNTKQ